MFFRSFPLFADDTTGRKKRGKAYEAEEITDPEMRKKLEEQLAWLSTLPKKKAFRYREISKMDTATKRIRCKLTGCPDTTYLNSSTFGAHVKNWHPEKLHLGVFGEKVCPACEGRYTNKGEYNRHIRSHLRRKDFTCVNCALKFSTVFRLEQHVCKQGPNQELHCYWCPSICHSTSTMRKHIRKFHCDQRLKSFVKGCHPIQYPNEGQRRGDDNWFDRYMPKSARPYQKKVKTAAETQRRLQQEAETRAQEERKAAEAKKKGTKRKR